MVSEDGTLRTADRAVRRNFRSGRGRVAGVTMTLDRLGIHESVAAVFAPENLQTELADVDLEVAVVDTDGVADCDGVVTLGHEKVFLESNVTWIHSIQAGVDRFPVAAFRERSTALTNSTGIHGDAVGETVVGYLLAFARGLHRYRSNQAATTWERLPWDRPFTLNGASLCVVGLGTLGRGIAARADALGMDVVGVKRVPTPVDHVETVFPSTALHEAISDARFVALAVPLTEDTRGLIGARELDEMRDDAVLVNVARGSVVDESALVDALAEGRLAGAALDVFEEEPLPADSPLWDMDEVIVTPHVAAATEDYHSRIAALVRENVRRSAAGDDLVNRVA
jgi:D-2-hydroxyacid dehydrogenase (NADP+)